MNWQEFIGTEITTIGKNTIWMGQVLASILLIIVVYVSIKIIRRILLKPRFLIDKIDGKRRISIFLITKYVVWIACVLVVLKVLGFDITLLLFGSTAVLVGLGFGLQDIFKDVVSGLFLLFEGSLKIGDVIEADGEVGKVTEIHLRSSEIRTRDDVTIIIPNSRFISDKVINWSHENESVRFSVGVNLAYGSDVELVIKSLESVMKDNPHVVSKPKPFVRFTDFGESALQFELIFWSRKSFEIENIKSDMRRAVYQKLKENNLAIPFPQRDVHIKGVEQIINTAKTKEL